MSLTVRIYLVLVDIILVPVDSARILAVFPVPSISHQVVFRPLTQELARRGHEVVILTPDPAFSKGKAPENITEFDFHDLSYNVWSDRFVKNIKGKSEDSAKIMEAAFAAIVEVFELQIRTKEVQNLFNSDQHFDLIFTEACVRSALVMSHLFKAPLIQISSLGGVPPNFQVMGAPSHPIYFPEMTRKKIYNMSLWDKFTGIYEDFHIRYLVHRLEILENEMLKRNFGSHVPDVAELTQSVEMLFLNVDPMWDSNRPVPPGVLYLGNLHQKPQKDLPHELKTFLDGSRHGVIYMSFGTNMNPSQLNPGRLQVFTRVFSKIPYDILWKWDKDVLPDKPKNVRISKWLPQSDLLRHPKVKLFITQAGLQSTDETIAAGVPVIAFPMLGDQWYNAEKYVHYNIGKKLDIETVSETTLMEAIDQVIQDESYCRNIKRLSKLMRDRPQSPLERAVWWTEYVIRHGGAKHLRSAAANVSWTEYLMLDVVASAAVITTLVTLVIGSILRHAGASEKIKTG